MTGELTVDELRQYTRCSLAWFYEKRMGLTRPRTTTDLIPESIAAAQERFYTGQAASLSIAVGQIWQDWCAEWGEPSAFGDLKRYARERALILEQFEKGAFRKDNGGFYTAPQMTGKYRDLMHARGTHALGRKLDELAAQRGLQLAEPESERFGRVGGAVGDAFAEALTAAERMTHNASQPLPGREIVAGLQIPFVVELNSALRLSGTLDVVRQAPGDDDAVDVEVHDFDPQPFVRAGLAARDLRVLTAALARSASEEIAWNRVNRVIYRHWLTGETYSFQEANIGHLLAVAAAAARGMQHQVVAPRALVGFEACRACAYRGQCWSESGWNSLPLLDPGRLEYAERAREVIRAVKAAAGGDEALRRRLAEALGAVEAELVRLDPGLADMVALTRAARAALEH